MKKLSHIKFLLFTFLTFVLIGVSHDSFGASKILSTHFGAQLSSDNVIYYCTDDSDDFLTGDIPSTDKEFKNVLNAPFELVDINNSTNPTTAIIRPSNLAPGTYKFSYHNGVFTVVITNAPALTSPATGTVCSNVAQNYTITSDIDPTTYTWSRAAVAGVTPATGSGAISTISETLTNSTAMPIDVVYEIVPAAGCATTLIYTVTVNPTSTVTSAATGDVCSGVASSYTITSNLIGTTFAWSRAVNPNISEGASAGVTSTIMETLTNTSLIPVVVDYVIIPTYGTCDGTTFTYQLTVNPNPVVAILGLDYIDPNPPPWYCDSDGVDALTGNPAGGIFSGNGITNTAAGADFNTATAGLGLIDITYVYTDANGCISPIVETTRVGTQIYINGLSADICQNAAIDAFTYTPFDITSVISGNGVSDLPVVKDGNASFDPTDIAVIPGANTITYQYTDAAACVNTITQDINVGAVPTASFSGLSANYCENDGSSILLTGNSAPNGSFTGDGIVDNLGTGTATLTPSSLAVNNAYSITYNYTTGVGCSDDFTKTFDIIQAPTVAISGNSTICDGTNTPLNFIMTGGANYDFTYTDGFGSWNIANVASPHIINVSPVSSRTYTTTAVSYSGGVPNACTATGTGSAAIIVTPQVQITTEPVDDIACIGNAATFTIVATGTANLQYEWFVNNVSVLVGASNILALNNVQLVDDGDLIKCEVSSTTCAVTVMSIEATLSVLPPTSITTHPASATKCTNGSVSFTVVATGNNLTYLWKKNGVAIADIIGKISGSTTDNLFIATLVASDADNYTCEVSGSCGIETSNPAVLDIDDPIVITLQPTDKTGCIGDNIAYNTAATGTNLNYEWYKDNIAIVPAEINTTLPINGIIAGDAGIYYCEASSLCGEVVSTNSVTFVLNNPTLITNHPANASICQGDAINFVTTATGTNLTYIWYKGANPIVPAETNAVLSLINVALADVGNYRCEVTGACGTLTTNAATLLVEEAVTFNTQPVDVAVCSGTNATFVVDVNGSNLLYDWEINNVPIGGANNSNYTALGAAGPVAGNYRCKISNACGDTYSDEVQLIVQATTVITSHPTNITTCEGSNDAFLVTASGTNLSYEWYKDVVALAPPETNPTLNITGALTADEGSYTCVVTGTCGAITSAPGVLVVDIASTIATHPQSAINCPTENTNLTVVAATGTNLNYQWNFDNGGGFANIGANSPIYNIPSFAAVNEGDYYCKITNGCGFITSNTVSRNLGVITGITVQPTATSGCIGDNANFNITTLGSGLTHQWRLGGVPLIDDARIVGSLTNNLSITGIVVGDVGNYSCEVVGDCGSDISNSVALVVDEPVVITLNPSNSEICEGGNTSFSINATGTGINYLWYKDLAPIAPAETGTSYVIGGAVIGTHDGAYYCKVSNGCTSVNSNTANLIVNETITIPALGQPAPVASCEGASVNFTVTPSTGTDLSYQWRKDGADIFDVGTVSGTGTNTLTITGVLVGDEADYSCYISSMCDAATSLSASLTVSEAIAITTHPQSQTGCNGSSLNLTTIATGTNLTYLWYKDAAAIPIETNPTFTIGSYVVGGDNGAYYCEITNSCGVVNTNSATITDGVTTVITSDPVNELRCVGDVVGFNIVALGTNLSYQWQKDGVDLVDDGRITTVNSNTLSIANIVFLDFGEYSCNVTGDCGVLTSLGATLTVRKPPVITTQPVSDTVCDAGISTFNIVATGDNLTYQWQVDAVAIGGEINTALTISPATVANEGVYNCLVSNIACGFVTSTSADLVVYDNLAIIDPISQTTCEGNNMTFVAGITGSPNLSAQWYKDGVLLVNGGQISGAQSSILGVNSITGANQGAYYIDVASRCGSLSSNISTLTVDENITITIHPTSFSVLNGNDANFTVAGSGNITGYQWRKNGADLVDLAGQISGALTPTLTVIATDIADEGSYTCLVAGSCIDANSNPANLTVLASSLISVHPITPVIKCEGETLNLSITSTGTIFEWRVDGIALVEGGDISGSATQSLTLLNLTVANQGAYTCFVDGVEGSLPSVVMVNPSTTIGNHPISSTKCEGDNAIFTITANGAGLGYQWQKNNANIIGETNDTYTINPLVNGDNGSYHCNVTGTCGNLPSSPATLIVNINSVITNHPVGVTICEETSTTLSVVATGSGLNYQWYKNGSIIADGGSISGTNSKDLLITNALLTDAGIYNCQVQGLCGTINSNDATIVVNIKTSITLQPINRTLCETDNVVFNISSDGDNLTYQWYKDVAIIVGATNSHYTINGVNKTDEGAFACMVSGTCSNATSNPAVLKVNNLTTINTHPIGGTICENNSIALNFDVSGDNLSYQWSHNGGNIADGGSYSGVATADLSISNAIITDDGIYTCSVLGACGNVNSNTAQVFIDPATVINTHPQNEVRCETDVVTFVVNASGKNLTYQWQSNGTDLVNGGNVSGAISSSLNIINLTIADADNYTCIVTGDCNSIATNAGVLTVNTLSIINTQPADAIICEGSSTNIIVDATGTNLTYQWRLDGLDISDIGNFTGTNTNTLQISNSLTTNEGTYTCVITGDCFSVNSQPAYITVLPTTSIDSEPLDKTRCTGDNVLFSTNALGDNLTYQWQLNNADILGATLSSFTINPILNTDNGAYTCVVSGTCGDVITNPAILTVQLEPVVNTQPTDVTICAGNVSNFTFDVTGTNLNYQWQKNSSDIVDGGNVSGANTNTLNIDLSTNNDEGIYKCDIVGLCGSANSNAVLLTVTDSTTITLHPINVTIVEGSDAFFNVVASGNIVSYKWQKDGVPLNDIGNISGSSTSLLSVSNVTTIDEASYTCIVSGTCGDRTSNPALLRVDIPVNITLDPLDATKCIGEATSFTVSATGTGLTYQWQYNGSDIIDGGTISGATSVNLIISAVATANAGIYSCLVTGNFGNDNSVGAILIVNETVAITQQPATQTKCESDNLVLEVIADGDAILYQWSKDNVDLVDNVNIIGSNASLLIITNISNADDGAYRCALSNTCNSEISNPAVITINPSVAFSTNPISIEKCETQTVNFTVVATGVGVQYQWYKNGTALINGVNIIGVNTNNLIINNLLLTDAGNYSCYISDNCSTANSSVAALTINTITQITSQPSDIVSCENQTTHFEVIANGHNIIYQWQKDGIDVSDGGDVFGSNQSVLVTQNSNTSHQGNYRCIITGGCSDELTSPANLAITNLPIVAGVIAGSSTVCQGEANVLYVVPTIDNATTYIWSLPYGASIVSGNESRSIEVDYATDAQSGTISVHGQNSCGDGVESASVGITVNTLPTSDASVDQIVCGVSTVMNANAVVGEWSIFSGDAVIANTNMFNTNIDLLKQGESEFVWTVSQSGCTASDTVIINNTIVTINAGDDQVVCSKSTYLQAQEPIVGAVWTVVNGSGFIADVTAPSSEVTSLSQGLNQFAWMVNNMGCISSDIVSITNDQPLQPNGGVNQIVDADQTILDASFTEVGTIGVWSILSGGGLFSNINDPKTLMTNISPGENILLWSVKRNNCILGDTIIIENTVIDDPEAGSNQIICANSTVLDATIPNVGTGEWSVISGAAEIIDIKNNKSSVINIGHGNNWLRWTVRTSGNGVKSDSILIVNNEATQANAGSDVTICDDFFALVGNVPIHGAGLWTLNSGSGQFSDVVDPNALITVLGQGANELKWTITNNNCITEAYVTITNNTPTVAVAGADQTVCYDSTLLLPNSPSVGIGAWSLISGSGTFVDNVVTQMAPDQNMYRYTITLGNCKSVDDIIITNNKPTTPVAGYNQKICTNTVALDANQALQGISQWTIISGSGQFSNISIHNPTVSNISDGLNIYRWTIAKNGCSEHEEVSVSNNFVLANAGLDVELCEDEYKLLALNPSPGMGTWSIVGTSGAIFVEQNNPNTTVTNLSNGNNQLRWTVVNDGCVSSDDIIVTNFKPSDARAGENQAICGKSVTLRANTPMFGTGLWVLMSGIGSFDDETDPNTTVRDLGVGENVLRWIITEQNCFSSDEATITSNLPTNVFGGNDQIVCSDTAILTANAPTIGTGQWSIIRGSGNFDNANSRETVIRNLGKGDNLLKWMVSSSDCHTIDTVVITSNIPTASVAGADKAICSNEVILAGNTPAVGVGEWILISGSAVVESPNNPNSIVSSIQLGNTTLRWSISKDGCYSNSEMSITNNQPSTPFAGYNTDICTDSVRLFAEPPTVGVGVWSLVSGDAVINNPDSNQTSVQHIKFGDNTFRWTITNGNCVLQDDVVIANNYEYVYAGEDRQVNTPSIQLIANKPSVGSGLWTVSASPASIESPESFKTIVSSLGSGANVFTWTITNKGCVATDEVAINYVVMPNADFEPSSTEGCPPLLVNFINTSIGGAPYSWDFGDGEVSNDPNIQHTYSESGAYRVVLTATAPLGILVTKDTIITVYDQPIAEFDIAPKTIYIPGEHISCFNYSYMADTNQWFFGDGSDVVDYAPTYTYTEEGIYDITLRVTSDNGCVDTMVITDAVEVLAKSNFFFPEGFTPNLSGGSGGRYDTEDRSNDIFYPIIIDGELSDYEFVVYSRVGVMIFRTNDVNIGWDGYYKNKLQPHDVYIYLVTGRYNNGEPFKLTGNVLLIVKDN